MQRLLIGAFEQILGDVRVDDQDQWIVSPRPEVSSEAVVTIAERVYRAFQRTSPTLMRSGFLVLFRKETPALALRQFNAWAQRPTAPPVAVSANTQRLIDAKQRAQQHVLQQVYTQKRA